MNDKSLNDFDSLCWIYAKQHFSAMGQCHITRMIEHKANKELNETNELDSKKP
jgi:hypothetical protein